MFRRLSFWTWVVALLVALLVLLIPRWRTRFLGLVHREQFDAGMPESYWQEILHDKDVDARIEAIRELTKACPKSEFPHPAVVAALNDENADVRLCAAECLGDRGLGDKDPGPPAPEAIRASPALIAALKDRHAGVRKEAARSILRIVGCVALLDWHQTQTRALRIVLRKTLSGCEQDTEPLVRENASRVLKLLREGQ
jgi:hypothetical protein